jgi:hypothetical protein
MLASEILSSQNSELFSYNFFMYFGDLYFALGYAPKYHLLGEEVLSSGNFIYINPSYPNWNALHMLILSAQSRHIHNCLGTMKLNEPELKICLHRSTAFVLNPTTDTWKLQKT